MDEHIRQRLTFNGQNEIASSRENWREALSLLPDPVKDSELSQLILSLPTTPHLKEKMNALIRLVNCWANALGGRTSRLNIAVRSRIK